MKKVIGLAALALALAQIGCATSSHRQFAHSEAEVLAAMAETEKATLMALQASPISTIAEAARLIAAEDAAR